MKRIPTADFFRMALAPAHLLIGSTLIVRFVGGARTPMVLVLGIAFVVYGVYKLALIRRGLKTR